MKIYISGPMSGLPNLNFGEFEDAEQYLTSMGHEVVNPHKIVPKDTPYAVALRLDLIAQMSCDAVCFLPGWNYSNGSRRLEFVAAAETDQKIYFGTASVPLGLI